MAAQFENLSSDVIWECARKSNAFLCKRKQGGGLQFSRDPMNLSNKHSRKYEGFLNDRAIGIQPDSNTVTLTTKIASKYNKPVNALHASSFSATTPSRKLYESIVNSTAKKGYRPDLRHATVARASAIKASQRKKKAAPAPKLRGAKAKKAAVEKS